MGHGVNQLFVYSGSPRGSPPGWQRVFPLGGARQTPARRRRRGMSRCGQKADDGVQAALTVAACGAGWAGPIPLTARVLGDGRGGEVRALRSVRLVTGSA